MREPGGKHFGIHEEVHPPNCLSEISVNLRNWCKNPFRSPKLHPSAVEVPQKQKITKRTHFPVFLRRVSLSRKCQPIPTYSPGEPRPSTLAPSNSFILNVSRARSHRVAGGGVLPLAARAQLGTATISECARPRAQQCEHAKLLEILVPLVPCTLLWPRTATLRWWCRVAPLPHCFQVASLRDPLGSATVSG